ncbi:hypothetical protein [Pedobacter faecalis]|uniref:hypothetical protein n=1 Tax=Pedobacter faecalis TaxID=3041495 RepID=UPI00254D7A78|nr:hypothetical protein [Pedobacter sp. ELA7]
MKRSCVLSLFLLFALPGFAQQLQPGSAMPRGVFYTLDDKAFSTDQIPKTKKSLIMLFDATCEHCQKIGASLSKRNTELADINIYMVTLDEPRSIDYYFGKFAKPLRAMKNVTILRDKDMVFIPLFRPKQYPALYLYGRDKTLTFYSTNEKDVPKFFTLIKQP